MKHLDLYAKIEPYIGFYEEYEKLYGIYLKKLSRYDIRTVLDVGCGNGNLLVHLQKIYQASGIDISPQMVRIAKAKGVDANCMSIDEVVGSYDAILAVSDLLNYFDKDALREFLLGVEQRLNDGGIFICDINTLFGFEEVTAGSLSIDKGELFISIDSEFEDAKLQTQITLFEKEGECFIKEQAEILQYYHLIKEIEELTTLKLVDIDDIALFSDLTDKYILSFKKEITI